MDETRNGRPPYPTAGADVTRTAQMPPADGPGPAAQEAGPSGTHDVSGGGTVGPGMGPGDTGGSQPRRGGTVRPLLMGLVGGAIGAVAVSLALTVAGVGGVTKVVRTSESSAGQTITLDALTEDATVSKAVAAKALPSVVSVYVASGEGVGLGSGVVLDTEGNIITNYHVVEDATSIAVTIAGKSYDATVIGTDSSSDLAVVRAELDGDAVTPIEIGNSDDLVVGDWVMTIGSPFGLDQSVSAGIVSSLSRNQLMQSAAGSTLYTNLIQTDASINPGNSGGALVDAEGKLVGISTLFSSDTESFAGIGFAIPGNYAIDIAGKIIAGEPVTHAYIGLSMQTVNAQNAQQYRLPVNQGAYVAEVTEGGPAAKAGLREGDIIIGLAGEEITSADGMILAVRGHKIDETVEITFVRDGKEMTTEVTFGDDAELQRQQQQQREQQNDQGIGLDGGQDGRGYGNDISYEEILEYLFNNRGGSYVTE
ncbi:MAG: trypsin-like peptidase domain-containing protein [Acidobacteriota bacterium]|nr:trypsin-like peptidase domain-containing protein [Acidobacteriota bacterium]